MASPDTPCDGLYARLAAADPARRSEIVLQLLTECGDRPFELPATSDGRWTLDGIDLSRERLRPREGAEAPTWWDATRNGVEMRRARFAGASLRHANLHGGLFEEADLSHTD